MDVQLFDFDLPEHLIAQQPLQERTASRLLVLHKETGELEHRQFRDLIDYLAPGDVLVLNDSRVLPARLIGVKPTYSRREKLMTSVVSGVLGATVSTPPYVLGRVGLLMLGSDVLLIPGIVLLALGVTLQAGATGAVRAIKLSVKLTPAAAPAAGPPPERLPDAGAQPDRAP